MSKIRGTYHEPTESQPSSQEKEEELELVRAVAADHFLNATVPGEKAKVDQFMRGELGDQQQVIESYVREHLALMEAGRGLEHSRARTAILEDYTQLMQELGLPESPYGADQSWLYRDIAKQSYLSQPGHQAEVKTNFPYFGDPLTDKSVQLTIEDRHVGWELYRAVHQAKPFTLPQWFKNSKRREDMQNLLDKPADKNHTLSDDDLLMLGRAVRMMVEEKTETNSPDVEQEASAQEPPLAESSATDDKVLNAQTALEAARKVEQETAERIRQLEAEPSESVAAKPDILAAGQALETKQQAFNAMAARLKQLESEEGEA